ncbi:MAG: DNA-directed DNA polymerase II small subunit [Candidatus Nanohaloarchaeota archaeon QJJ-7]|nr:DNA-directed DNA polymerase II small subunit [Candidatus Nanohaloarchaeota archaeon QJJ-7]
MDRQEAVKELTSRGCIVEPEAVDRLEENHIEKIKNLSPSPMVVNERLIDNLESGDVSLESSVDVITEIEMEKEKRDVQDFVDFYNDRYEKIKSLLLRRREIQSAVSISRLEDMEEREEVAAVGIVKDKYKTSKGKFIVYMEDPSGETKVLAEEEDGANIVQDEVIGVKGSLGDDIIFADRIVWPDVPLPDDIQSTSEEVYAAFISDIHFGSKDTMEEKLDKLLDWLNSGNSYAQKIKYLFVAGDAVEGVGVYPSQKEELEVTNIYKQYERFQEFVEEVRDDVQVIIGPGNHDFVRLAEPQPPLPEESLPDVHMNDNVHMVPNPAYVKVHGHDNGGVKVLMYHGYSFDEHVDSLPHLRDRAYENPEHAMIDWLKRRHLAPIYGSNLVVPDDEDPLVIEEVPEILVSGHTHSFAATTYKGINVICAGTFQSQTDFQKRMGHQPDPGKVAVVNLKTRETEVKEF